MPNQAPDSQAVLITGITGSFGKAFAQFVLRETNWKVRGLSRDEHKQADLARSLPPGPRMTYILGDVRDDEKVAEAADGCAAIVHAAALKRVDSGERFADEFVLTDILGTQRVIRAALMAQVPKTLLISSDKAAQPINAYGKCKAVAESLIVQANARGVSRACRFAAVRGGNVWASRGSVAQAWQAARADSEPIIVYGQDVTRFHLEMPAWCEFCWQALSQMHGGEIFAPKIRAWGLADLAQAFGGPVARRPARHGDKQAETLVTHDEAARTVDAGWAYVIQPSGDITQVWDYQPWPGVPCPNAGWAYSSDAVERIGADELAALVRAL